MWSCDWPGDWISGDDDVVITCFWDIMHVTGIIKTVTRPVIRYHVLL